MRGLIAVQATAVVICGLLLALLMGPALSTPGAVYMYSTSEIAHIDLEGNLHMFNGQVIDVDDEHREQFYGIRTGHWEDYDFEVCEHSFLFLEWLEVCN